MFANIQGLSGLGIISHEESNLVLVVLAVVSVGEEGGGEEGELSRRLRKQLAMDALMTNNGPLSSRQNRRGGSFSMLTALLASSRVLIGRW